MNPDAVAAAALVYDGLKTRKLPSQVAVLALLITAQLFTAPFLSREMPQHANSPSRWLSLNAPPYNRALPVQIAAARSVVEKSLAPGAPL